MTTVKIQDTRQPSLTRAVIRQIGERDNLEEVARHGADGGFPGFTMTRDCVAFFRKHRTEIIARLEQDADDFGQDVLEMVRNFGCLKHSGHAGTPTFSTSDVGAALFSNRGDFCDTIQNALAWYAAEEIARELNPDL